MNAQRAALAALIALLCLRAGQVSAAIEPSCEALSLVEASEALREANKESAKDPEFYRQFHCPVNTSNLYCFIQKKFPRLKPQDFRVIYFVRPGFINTLRWMDFERNFRMNARGNPVDDKGRPLTWRYHVVLEHNQMIYDLDQSENPIPLSPEKYLSFMFPENLNAPLDRFYGGVRAFVFPGEEYLTLPVEMTNSQEFLVNTVNFNRGVTLKELPETLKNSSSILPNE